MATDWNDQIGRLYTRLGQAGTIETLKLLLREVEALERAGQGNEGIDTVREQVFEGLLRLATDQPDQARAILLDDLLPLCLRSKEEWPARSMRGRYEEILRTWLDTFPGSTRESLRASVLSVVAGAMNGPRVEPACATLWYLGHRSGEVVDALGAIASAHDDEIGDLALRTRVHLGVREADRAEILEELHRRAERRWNHSLVAALQELADRDSLDVVFTHLGEKEASSYERGQEFFLADVAMQIPSAIAANYPQDDVLQDAVWNRLMSLGAEDQVRSALVMNSKLTSGVDSPHIVDTYMGLFHPDSGVRRDVVYYRLEDLVRPRQLLGWDCDPDDRALSVLRRDALDGTAMESAWVTQELRRKLLAWETLLSLGRTDLSPLIEPAVEAETNGYAVGDVLDIVACMAIDSLPRCVPELIAARFSGIAMDSDQRLIAHIAAIHVAHSARSREAFQALLDFEKVRESGVLLSLIEALADCAAADTTPFGPVTHGILWKLAHGPCAPHHRTAAAAALARLMRRRVLAVPFRGDILDLIGDESLDIFARRELLDASGYIGESAQTPRLVAFLGSIAGQSRPTNSPNETAVLPDLWPVALGALARLGVLATDESLLSGALGLVRTPEGWTLPLVQGWASPASFVIGMLYAEDPEAFAPAVASLVRACDWIALSRLVPHLPVKHHATPSIVVEAIVDRIHRVQTGRTAEPELFSLLARLSPARLVQEPWGDPSSWMPQARSEFADAVATARPSVPELQKTLLPLLGDGQYGVRRSAYRAMASVDAEALATVCESWARTEEGNDATELRQRAAEAAAWLPRQFRTPAIEALESDPEPTVRQAFARCNRERCEREWAAHYVDLIIAVEEERKLPSVWRYGRAIGEIGDDHALARLETRRQASELPPAVRYWLTRIIKKVRKHWDEVTRRWPEPWFARRGRLEEVTGFVIQDGGAESPFRGSLWHVIESEPMAISSWGGWSLLGRLSTGTATLMIDGRKPAEILVSRVSMPSGTSYFSGKSPYPSPIEQVDRPTV